MLWLWLSAGSFVLALGAGLNGMRDWDPVVHNRYVRWIFIMEWSQDWVLLHKDCAVSLCLCLYPWRVSVCEWWEFCGCYNSLFVANFFLLVGILIIIRSMHGEVIPGEISVPPFLPCIRQRRGLHFSKCQGCISYILWFFMAYIFS
jgi:hypothetical protein